MENNMIYALILFTVLLSGIGIALDNTATEPVKRRKRETKPKRVPRKQKST